MEEVLILSRWQFAVTSTYHFLFVPLTIGLSILVAIFHTIYAHTGNEMYKQHTKFWGKLFLVSYSLGVVTGIIQEFHFGMNWSEYSRFMGDIFGAPLALEALTAFFLESVFIGIWIFGWGRISRKLHAACIWIVALASNLSAFWILVANSFMQMPVAYAIRNGRAEMTDFVELLTNPYVFYQLPHTVLGGLVTGGFFILSISAYHLIRKQHQEFFRISFKLSLVWTTIVLFFFLGSAHVQTQFIAKVHPMKIAASEALWETTAQAPFAIAVSIDEQNKTNKFEFKIPKMLSVLVHDDANVPVKGILDVEQEYIAKYGPGQYIPPVTPIFWSFRIMVAIGVWMVLLVLIAVLLWLQGRLDKQRWLFRLFFWSLPLPYIANSAGWLVAEVGRQPWIVFGLQTVEQAVSPSLDATSVWISLIGFTVIFALQSGAAIYLMQKFIRRGPVGAIAETQKTPAQGATLWS